MATRCCSSSAAAAAGRWRWGCCRRPTCAARSPSIYDRESGRVARLEFKPEQPSADRTWACASASARVLRGLEHEDEPGKYFNRLCPDGLVGAFPLPGSAFLDMGTPAGLEHALAALATGS